MINGQNSKMWKLLSTGLVRSNTGVNKGGFLTGISHKSVLRVGVFRMKMKVDG